MIWSCLIGWDFFWWRGTFSAYYAVSKKKQMDEHLLWEWLLHARQNPKQLRLRQASAANGQRGIFGWVRGTYKNYILHTQLYKSQIFATCPTRCSSVSKTRPTTRNPHGRLRRQKRLEFWKMTSNWPLERDTRGGPDVRKDVALADYDDSDGEHEQADQLLGPSDELNTILSEDNLVTITFWYKKNMHPDVKKEKLLVAIPVSSALESS